MRPPRSRSFRLRLFASFLAAGLIPLLVCSALLLQIFRVRMTALAAAQAQDYLNGLLASVDMLCTGLTDAAAGLDADPVVTGALTGEPVSYTQVYDRLFAITGEVSGYARLDLYDLEGRWRYSTQAAPSQTRLATDWGVLYAAVPPGRTPEFIAAEDVTDPALPLLQGAVLLTDQSGAPAGYLLISLSHSHFQALLEGKYGTQNDLILLSRYWRPIYSAQPSLAAALAPQLRARLLAGQSLAGLSEDFLYSVASHTSTGLCLVLRQPQVLTGETTALLRTVSLSCVLICVLVSVLMSILLSRQIFLPIRRLHRAMDQVEQNDLDAQVPHTRDDELGQLAQRFNHMVQALKRNQDQLVENQRELNEAQIRMLQAQLNPHFLCNTLDTMKWISKINKVPQVALMSTDLADILRFCISPDELVPLHREAEILERYIEIQRIRLSGKLNYRAHIPQQLAGCLVPKLVLQPIVENSILHGLDGASGGEVTVEAREGFDGMLLLTVSDNGQGFPQNLIGPYGQPGGELLRGHLGLYNIHTILRKYYGEGSGLYLDNRTDGPGARVTAVLPLSRKEEDL